MYRWIVLLHVQSVLGFVLLHEAPSAMFFMRLQRETDPERVKALLALSVHPGLSVLDFLGVRSLNVIRADLGLQSSYGEAPSKPEYRAPYAAVQTHMAELPAWPQMAV